MVEPGMFKTVLTIYPQMATRSWILWPFLCCVIVYICDGYGGGGIVAWQFCSCCYFSNLWMWWIWWWQYSKMLDWRCVYFCDRKRLFVVWWSCLLYSTCLRILTQATCKEVGAINAVGDILGDIIIFGSVKVVGEDSRSCRLLLFLIVIIFKSDHAIAVRWITLVVVLICRYQTRDGLIARPCNQCYFVFWGNMFASLDANYKTCNQFEFLRYIKPFKIGFSFNAQSFQSSDPSSLCLILVLVCTSCNCVWSWNFCRVDVIQKFISFGSVEILKFVGS